MDSHLISEIDFSETIQQNPDLANYIQDIVKEIKEDGKYPEPMPIFELHWSRKVVVDNLPSVQAEKADNLITVLAKVISKAGFPINPGDINMPMEAERNLGFAFVTFEDDDVAKSAISKCDGLHLGSQNQLKLIDFTEFDRVMETPEHYTEKKVFSQGELKNWLADAKYRDQFAIRHKNKTEVYWNDAIVKTPELVPSNAETSRYLKWSVCGTYIATFHLEGAIIWGGASFELVYKLNHYAVSALEFSPCERYLITHSAGKYSKFGVWDMTNGEEIRSFSGKDEKWGCYKWSFDGEYLAKMGDDCIFVYQTTDMALLQDTRGERAPISIPNIATFEWSPGANMICCYTNEVRSHPGQLRVLAIPSQKPLFSKGMYDALGCNVFWQGNGDYCIGLVTTKRKGSTKPRNSILEILFFTARGIVSESISLQHLVVQLVWEPFGEKFAYVYDITAFTKYVIVCEIRGGFVQFIGSVETKNKAVLWAPFTSSFVTCTYAQKQGQKGHLEFFTITPDALYNIEEIEYSNMNYVEWDPTGRFLLIATTVPLDSKKGVQGSGYSIKTFLAQPVFEAKIDEFYQIAWRPRPRNILPKEAEREILLNLEKNLKTYESNDTQLHKEAQTSKKAQQKQLRRDFLNIIEAQKRLWEDTARERAVLLGRTDEEEAGRWRIEELMIEEILKVSRHDISKPS